MFAPIRSTLLASLVLAAACGDTTAPIEANPDPDYDLIFESAVDQLNQTTLRRLPGGATATQLVFGDSRYAMQPEVSADGRYMVYLAPSTMTPGLAVWWAHADGTGAQQVYNAGGLGLGEPTISPNGSRVAFTQYDTDGGSAVMVARADGFTFHAMPRLVLLDGPVIHTSPAWSPDGTRLALSAGHPGHLEIYTTPVDGVAALTKVTTTTATASDTEASWAPTNDRLVFVRSSSPARSASRIVTLATKAEQVVSTERNPRQPVWSPKGDRIAYAGRLPGEAYDIYTLHLQSGAVQQLTASPQTDRFPTWSRRNP